MSHVRRRTDARGRARFTGYCTDSDDVVRSAGTYGSRAEAVFAAQDAEARVRAGVGLDVAAARSRFADYARRVWLPGFVGELSTREWYAVALDTHLIPHFGHLRMMDVTSRRVREYFALLRDSGVGAATQVKCRTVLSSLFNTAVADRVVAVHPCAGVPAPEDPQGPLRVLVPEEFERIKAAMPDERMRLLMDVAIESGCRWGELAELRAGDLDTLGRTLMVARAVAELRPGRASDRVGGFVVKQYPKNGEWRKVAISKSLAQNLAQDIESRRLAPGDLLFPARGRAGRRPNAIPEPAGEVFALGNRRFVHGTLYAYAVGRCRCRGCAAAYANYRSERRAVVYVSERARAAGSGLAPGQRHMRRDWFRNRIWQPAVRAAGIEWTVRVHDLRHACGSWALAGRASAQDVRAHLGHKTLRATERYLHNLPGTERDAHKGLDKSRRKARRKAESRDGQSGAKQRGRGENGGARRRREN